MFWQPFYTTVLYKSVMIIQFCPSSSDGEDGGLYIGKTNRWMVQDCSFHPFTYIFRLGAGVAQWLACQSCNPGVAGLITRSSSLSDETLNRGPISMT